MANEIPKDALLDYAEKKAALDAAQAAANAANKAFRQAHSAFRISEAACRRAALRAAMTPGQLAAEDGKDKQACEFYGSEAGAAALAAMAKESPVYAALLKERLARARAKTA